MAAIIRPVFYSAMSHAPQLDGKVVIVTGGSRGIGRATAARFVRAGAKVVIAGRTKADLDRAVAGFEAPGSARGVQADVSREADVARLVDEAVAAFGGLDVVVNNAATVTLAEVERLPVAEWQAMLDANLTGPFLLCRAAIPHLKRRGGGSIVNVSSLAGQNPFAGGACYAATKAGLDAFSHALMQELRHDNIRVSVVAPGSVATGFGGKAPGQGDAWKLSPEDVAETIFHLVTHPARSLPSRVDLRPSRPQKG
jgi:NAD(P)-dependent dehydrogenase (short-subunit alcohol dehydrogenase family)